MAREQKIKSKRAVKLIERLEPFFIIACAIILGVGLPMLLGLWTSNSGSTTLYLLIAVPVGIVVSAIAFGLTVSQYTNGMIVTAKVFMTLALAIWLSCALTIGINVIVPLLFTVMEYLS